jgi:hypothetical protein
MDLLCRGQTCQVLDARHLVRHDGGEASSMQTSPIREFSAAETMLGKAWVLEVPGGSWRSLCLGRQAGDWAFRMEEGEGQALKGQEVPRRHSGTGKEAVDQA